MPQFTAIIRTLTQEKFAEVLAASGRKAREVYFHCHGIRAPKTTSTRLPRAGEKNEARTALLFAALRQHEDDELAEEVLRTWLLTKRPLLAAALDHLGIAHVDGLTDSDDLKRLEQLTGAELQTLLTKLEEVGPREDAVLYLRFMGVPGLDEAA